MAGPKILSLFSGVGGLEVAVRLALPGSEVVGYVERDSFACAALMARMEESSLDLAPVFCGEVQDLDGRELRGHVDVVCGGIPCQPYSIAGSLGGNEDDRALWPEFARIVSECGPTLVFIENVATFVTGGGFRPLGEELCRLGYDIADPFFISAGDLGAPHQRQRVFILAHRNFHGSEAERSLGELVEGVWTPQWDDAHGRDARLADAEDSHGRAGERGAETGVGEDSERRRGSPVSGEGLADASSQGRQGHKFEIICCSRRGSKGRTASEFRKAQGGAVGEGRVPDAIRNALRFKPERRRGPARTTERWHSIAGVLGLFPPGPDDEEEWGEILKAAPHLAPATEPGLCFLVDGVPVVLDESHADQLRCAGNAVVVAQAHVAFRQLLQWVRGE